ncbi:MAG TPA: pentapeptide repeat-containing protein [Ktedonobacteraceae bacterium]
MAYQPHLNVLRKGRDTWNRWRKECKDVHPDLRKANLYGADLIGYDLSEVNLNGANLSNANLSNTYCINTYLINADLRKANLKDANLRNANLSGASLNKANLNRASLNKANLSDAVLKRANLSDTDLSEADLSRADLSEANLSEANLRNANLCEADLSGADLRSTNLRNANFSYAKLNNANLTQATLVETDMREAILSNCSIYGISVWNIQLEKTQQDNLIITPQNEPVITVDNLKIAQFIYLLLNNQEIRDVIDTIAKKAVLILGRFTPERKTILDALRDALRQQNYLPILFDFEKPSSRDLTETVSTLAHLARFIIVDLTDPSSAPHEMATIIPQCIVPVQPLLTIDENRYEYAMFQDLRQRYHWVLPTQRYYDMPSLLTSLHEKVIVPAEEKAVELEQRKLT